MSRATRFMVIKYRFGANHVMDTLQNGVVGIPAHKSGRRSGPSGKIGFQQASSDRPMYYLLYDVDTQSVRGLGTTLGSAFYTDDEGTFQPDSRVPGQNWGHRIHGLTMIKDSKAIPRAEFLAMGGKLGQGAAAYVTEEVWEAVKDRMIATN